MLHELTVPLHLHGLRWKPSSLQYVVFGSDISCDVDFPATEDLVLSVSSDPTDTYRFRRVLDLEVLGCVIPGEVHVGEHKDVNHHVTKARKSFWGQAKYYKSQVIHIRDKYARYVQRLVLCGVFHD